MTLKELQSLVRDTINSIVNIPDVINYHPNAPRPSSDFATVHVASLRKIGTVDRKISTNVDDLDFKTVKLYEAMVSCNFYRNNSGEFAALVSGSLYDNHVTDRFNSSGAALTRVSEIRDLAEVFDASHEERSQFDAFIQFELTSVVEPVTGIDIINIDGTIDNSEKVIEQVSITI